MHFGAVLPEQVHAEINATTCMALWVASNTAEAQLARAPTNLIQQQHNALAGTGLAHKALHVRAAGSCRVTRVQHLQDDIRRLHNMRKVFEEGALRGLCQQRACQL